MQFLFLILGSRSVAVGKDNSQSQVARLDFPALPVHLAESVSLATVVVPGDYSAKSSQIDNDMFTISTLQHMRSLCFAKPNDMLTMQCVLMLALAALLVCQGIEIPFRLLRRIMEES